MREPSTQNVTAYSSYRRVGAILFLCLFAGQAGLIALSPVLADVAHDLGVSTALAGQLRMMSGLVAGMTALWLGRLSARLGLRRLLLSGAGLLALGSLSSAAAGTFAVLAVAQVVIGVAVAILLTAGTTAAAEWAAPEDRSRVLSWALAGPAGAWIIGMPLTGLLGGVTWRLSLLAVPVLAAGVALLALVRQPASATAQAPTRVSVWVALGHGAIRRWSISELLASAAWVGTLVYAGALLIESHGSSLALTGLALSAGGATFIAGNLFSRRFVTCDGGRMLVLLALLQALGIAAFGAVRPSLAVSSVTFGAAAFVAGGRTLISNSSGLCATGELRMAVMGLRAAANQLGYFIGAAVGGVALTGWGYPALGLALAGLSVLAAVTLVVAIPSALLEAITRPIAGRPTAGVKRPSPGF